MNAGKRKKLIRYGGLSVLIIAASGILVHIGPAEFRDSFDAVKFLIVLGYMAVTGALLRFMGLDLIKKLLLGVTRSILQLMIMGSVMLVVFEVENLYLNIGVLLVMIAVSSYTAAQHTPVKGALFTTSWVVLLTNAVVIIPMILLNVISIDASIMIPMSGMVIGNTMNGVSLAYDRLHGEITGNRGLIETYLALGIDARTACRDLIKKSMRAGMIPMMNSMMTTGLVHIPGLMTGMLLSGEDPIWAAELQAIIIYLIFIAMAISAILSTNVIYRKYFLGVYALKEEIGRGEG